MRRKYLSVIRDGWLVTPTNRHNNRPRYQPVVLVHRDCAKDRQHLGLDATRDGLLGTKNFYVDLLFHADIYLKFLLITPRRRSSGRRLWILMPEDHAAVSHARLVDKPKP
jgi:hypothetical protein